MYDFFLALLEKLDLFHLGVAQDVIQPSGLPQDILRDQAKCSFGAMPYALRISPAEIALDRIVTVLMRVDSSEGAGFHALVTGDAFLAVELHHPVYPPKCVGGADLNAGCHLALAADHRHPDHRMGVGDEDPDRALLRIIDAEMFDRADKFADPATGTQLRNDCQLFGHMIFFRKILIAEEKGGNRTGLNCVAKYKHHVDIIHQFGAAIRAFFVIFLLYPFIINPLKRLLKIWHGFCI